MAGRIPKVVIVGPVYVDLFVRCDQLPVQGQTIEGTALSFTHAGAGPNRAIEAAFCDCHAYLISKVGDDIFGRLALEKLRAANVNVDGVSTANAMTTGTTITFVDRIGENTTCICHGANKAFSAENITFAVTEQIICQADVVYIHGALPYEVVAAAIKTAKLYGKKVILEKDMEILEGIPLSEWDFPKEYYLVDILVPNFNRSVETNEINAGHVHKLKRQGSELAASGIECVVIKLGTRGTFVVNRHASDHIPGFAVERVDRTCCPDAFAGALAASIGAGDDVKQAVRFAAAAGALACSKFGAQESLPSKQDILELLMQQPD